MSEEKQEISMADVMDDVMKTFKDISDGDIIKGKVISVGDNSVVVDIGYHADGIIPIEEVSNINIDHIEEVIKIDDEIDVMVVRKDDGEGNVLLSKKKAEQIVVWDELQQKDNDGTIFEVKVNEVVNGGVVAYYKGVRMFIPASQLSIYFVEDLTQYVGSILAVKILELDIERKNVVLSRKIVEIKEIQDKKQSLFNTLEKGIRLKGIVRRITNFGAFVDIGGADGLLHINDMSWTRIKHPSDVVNVGDSVEVYIIDYDKKAEKISLGLKDVNGDPWNNVKNDFKVNDIVEGTITRLAGFGAFVQLKSGIEGLVHISEISEKRIAKPSDVLEEGQNVKVKILSIDDKQKKLSLSIKEAENDSLKKDIPEGFMDKGESSMATLGDLFKDKFKDLNL